MSESVNTQLFVSLKKTFYESQKTWQGTVLKNVFLDVLQQAKKYVGVATKLA
jgi:hypothetical protein